MAWGIASWRVSTREWPGLAMPVPSSTSVLASAMVPWGAIVWGVATIELAYALARGVGQVAGTLFGAWFFAATTAWVPSRTAVPVSSASIFACGSRGTLKAWGDDTRLDSDIRTHEMWFFQTYLGFLLSVLLAFRGPTDSELGVPGSGSAIIAVVLIGGALGVVWASLTDVLIQAQASYMERRIEMEAAEKLAFRAGLRFPAGVTMVGLIGMLLLLAILGTAFIAVVPREVVVQLASGSGLILIASASARWIGARTEGWRGLLAVLQGGGGLIRGAESEMLMSSAPGDSGDHVTGDLLVGPDLPAGHAAVLLNERRAHGLPPIQVDPLAGGDRLRLSVRRPTDVSTSRIWLLLARSALLAGPFKRLVKAPPRRTETGYL